MSNKESRKTLEGFHVEEVIGDRPYQKQLAVVGRFDGSDKRAVVLLSQKHLPKEQAERLLGKETTLELNFENDIYSKYDGLVARDLNSITIDMIYPATEKHVLKHTDQPFQMVQESPDDYRKCTLAYIESLSKSGIQWVYNILDKKAEVERVIFEDPSEDTGFVMLPDLKWDQKNLEELYCVVICKRRDIRCLRDLNSTHLPLLKNIREKGCEAIQKEYGVNGCDLRIFVHYPPTYYHFHVHFVHIKSQGAGSSVGKAHLLDDIIDNIEEIADDYYAKRKFSLVVGTNTDHWKFFEQGRAAKKQCVEQKE